MLNRRSKYTTDLPAYIGKTGESMAKDFFSSKGFSVVEVNYKYKKFEVDLIAKSGEDLLVFVEVKTRTRIDYGLPEDFVSEMQQERVLATADHYVNSHDWGKNIRFDVVSILVLENKKVDIQHFEDAFY